MTFTENNVFEIVDFDIYTVEPDGWVCLPEEDGTGEEVDHDVVKVTFQFTKEAKRYCLERYVTSDNRISRQIRDCPDSCYDKNEVAVNMLKAKSWDVYTDLYRSLLSQIDHELRIQNEDISARYYECPELCANDNFGAFQEKKIN